MTKKVQAEVSEQVNKKVQQNLAWILKKLGEANPNITVDIEGLGAIISSDNDDGTPMTGGTSFQYDTDVLVFSVYHLLLLLLSANSRKLDSSITSSFQFVNYDVCFRSLVILLWIMQLVNYDVFSM